MYHYRPKYYDEALYRGFLDATGIRLESHIRHDPSTFVATVVRGEEVLWKGEYAKSDLISIDDQLDITNIQRAKGLAFAREILDEVDWDDFFPTPWYSVDADGKATPILRVVTPGAFGLTRMVQDQFEEKRRLGREARDGSC